MNFLKNFEVKQVKAPQASAGTAVTSSAVDCGDCEGVIFLTVLGTSNSGNFLKLQQDTASGMGSAADLKGTKYVPQSDDEIAYLDVYQPREQYVRLHITRGGTNTDTGQIIAIKYDKKKKPLTNAKGEFHHSPAEGTA